MNDIQKVRRAHELVCQALKSGQLVRQPCEICGDPKGQPHHPNYNEPLRVEWLCRRHHMQHHHGRNSEWYSAILRGPLRFEFDGKTLSATQWAAQTGISDSIIYSRIVYYGWPGGLALTLRPAKGMIEKARMTALVRAARECLAHLSKGRTARQNGRSGNPPAPARDYTSELG